MCVCDKEEDLSAIQTILYKYEKFNLPTQTMYLVLHNILCYLQT